MATAMQLDERIVLNFALGPNNQDRNYSAKPMTMRADDYAWHNFLSGYREMLLIGVYVYLYSA